MAKRNSDDLVIGEDSFLDTCANLVGILIIFVVIAGARAKTASESASKQAPDLETELSQPIASAQRLESDILKQTQELQKYVIETDSRRRERSLILEQVQTLKYEIEERTKRLDQPDQEDVALVAEQAGIETRLKELLRNRDSLDESPPQVVALEHLPTPMAKTVFNEEVHVLLKQGQVTVIPWERLVEHLKKNASYEVRRSTSRDVIESQLGPIEGFLMHYRFVAKKGVVSNGQTVATAQMVELDRFELEPTEQILREPLERALSNNGRLRVDLAGRSPIRTVITVWTYPDSFGDFRRLKEALYPDGFLCAARPLPDGIRIGASPRGSSTMAQ